MEKITFMESLIFGCFIISNAILAVSSQSPKTMVNIDFIGLGYDVVKGNPHSNLYDPGFRRAVVEISYKKESRSSDNQWLVPDNVQVLQARSCDHKVESDVVTGMNSYQRSLSRDVSIPNGAWNFKFSGSDEYQEVKEGVYKHHKYFVESVAKCSSYKARIRSYKELQVTEEFKEAVDELPVTTNDEEYFNFIQRFGTHYASEMIMGAKKIVRSEFDQVVWAEMHMNNNFNIKSGAELSFLGFTTKSSYGAGSNDAIKTEFERKRSSYKVSFIGNHPPADGKWETWTRTSGDMPYPIASTLSPLTKLFIVKFISNHNSSQIQAKQKLLGEAIKKYCGDSVKTCSVPAKDRLPTYMSKVDTTIVGTDIFFSCQTGYSLLSCGFQLNGYTTIAHRYAMPHSVTQCRCADYYGNPLTCVAWCTKNVEGFQIVHSNRAAYNTIAQCPSGKKVIGCHMYQPDNRYYHFYPSDDGTSCRCYVGGGAAGTCVASCASNIHDYEIKKLYGNGQLVQCSPSNIVLGCEIQPRSDVVTQRGVYVYSIRSCYCYDNGLSTCYAICGKL